MENIGVILMVIAVVAVVLGITFVGVYLLNRNVDQSAR